ncbi:hypothetical protein FH609_004050 [Streptomyces sp. 3MP-14]|uniref:Uncharacterized protein n=1 Tax=Streptomyces mimosae TaxID=2586635 RepID=A0A5N6A2A8_9ACTN|nr:MULTISPECIES: hypothetical protein [Streptomyces]KAB8162907.1 hypothetical protein FH607_019915 [Streptomyces mimosae]KAB8179120.1 hypothetical protein FH609_004050 [Streptomyces sp. 3MP-14]
MTAADTTAAVPGTVTACIKCRVEFSVRPEATPHRCQPIPIPPALADIDLDRLPRRVWIGLDCVRCGEYMPPRTAVPVGQVDDRHGFRYDLFAHLGCADEATPPP